MNAFLTDMFQRIMTMNKYEQKRNLEEHLKTLSLRPDAKCLDFGCGTALFAPVFRKMGFKYSGYDIDQRLLDYASSRYKYANFTSDWEVLEAAAPFDLILANCCFHHIDSQTLDTALAQMKTLMDNRGIFMMIDILFPENDTHTLRTWFRKLEQGVYIRTAGAYSTHVKQFFSINESKIERSHLFSLKGCSVYNDLLILKCTPNAI